MSIMDKVKTVDFPPGEIICYEGDLSNHFFILVSGDAQVTALNEKSEQVVLAQITGGQVVGEMGVFNDSQRSATVTAVTDVKAFKIKKSDFEEIKNSLPDWVRTLIDTLTDRLKQSNDKILRLSAEIRDLKS